MDPVFAGQDPNGTWTLRLTDTCSGSFGHIHDSILLLLANLAVDDYYDVPFQAGIGVAGPGILANDITSTGVLKVLPALTSLPQHGVVGVGADGAFLYFPNAGYVGPDSFSYRAATLGAPSNVATVHLTVAPPAMTSGADATPRRSRPRWSVPAPGVLANDTTAAGTLSAVAGHHRRRTAPRRWPPTAACTTCRPPTSPATTRSPIVPARSAGSVRWRR